MTCGQEQLVNDLSFLDPNNVTAARWGSETLRCGCLPKSLALRKYYKASKPNLINTTTRIYSISLTLSLSFLFFLSLFGLICTYKQSNFIYIYIYIYIYTYVYVYSLNQREKERVKKKKRE